MLQGPLSFHPLLCMHLFIHPTNMCVLQTASQVLRKIHNVGRWGGTAFMIPACKVQEVVTARLSGWQRDRGAFLVGALLDSDYN